MRWDSGPKCELRPLPSRACLPGDVRNLVGCQREPFVFSDDLWVSVRIQREKKNNKKRGSWSTFMLHVQRLQERSGQVCFSLRRHTETLRCRCSGARIFQRSLTKHLFIISLFNPLCSTPNTKPRPSHLSRLQENKGGFETPNLCPPAPPLEV